MKSFRFILFFITCLCAFISCSSENNPAENSSEQASFELVFRGQTQNLESIEGLSVGDHLVLDVLTHHTTGIVNWRSLNPALGDFTNPGELQIKEEGRFLVEVRVGSLVKQISISSFSNPSLRHASCGNKLCEETEFETCHEDCEQISSPFNLARPSRVDSDPFVDEVISYQLGTSGGGLGADELPNIVLGPPQGWGLGSGSHDTFSLGPRGSIILRSETPILNGDGVDFIVFENAFYPGSDRSLTPFYELARVSVSQDGVQFYAYACKKYNSPLRFENCAGHHPVLSNPSNGISPIDISVSGGDPFDLQELGLDWISYIKIEDLASQELGLGSGSAGFDLDAISIVHQ